MRRFLPRGHHWLIRRKGVTTGYYSAGSLFYWRVLGLGYYRFRGERPYVLLPGRPCARIRRHLGAPGKL